MFCFWLAKQEAMTRRRLKLTAYYNVNLKKKAETNDGR